MGTYSQPSLVLDTSFSKASKAISDSTSRAIAAVQAQKNKEQQKAISDQKKKEKEEKDKRQRDLLLTKEQKEIQKEADKNILLTKKVKTGELRFGNDGFGEEGSVANLTIEQSEKYKEIRNKNLQPLELQAELTAAGLDQEVYNALGNESGEAIDDQLSNQMIANFSSLKGLDYKKEEYAQVKEIINIDRTKGIPLIATLYKIGEHTNPNNPGGPWTEDGLPLPPKKGKDGVPLYFTNEDQFDLKLNIAKDLSFGVNKGAYKYVNPGDGSDPFIRYTKSDGSTFKMTQEELSRSIERTGGAFIGTTSVENYNKYLDGLKSIASINFKGVAETYKKASEGEDNKVTATRKIRNLNKAKKDLRKFVDEQIEVNGLGTTSYTGNIVQNNWQLMGGPIEAKPGDPKPNGGVYTLEEIKNSYQWNRKSYAQREIAKEKLYNDMYTKYMADENISFSEFETPLNSAIQKQDAENLLTSAISIPGSQRNFANTYFGTPIGQTQEGDISLGLESILTNYPKLKKDNFKGQLELLNMYGNDKYMSGADLSSNQEIVDVNGNPIMLNKSSLYIRSGNTYVQRKDLEAKDNFIRELRKVSGMATPTVLKESMKLYKRNQSGTSTNVDPNPLINQNISGNTPVSSGNANNVTLPTGTGTTQ